MAFQDRAESLAERLHLGRVPRPVFVAIALALMLMVALAVCAFAMAPDVGFEVRAESAAAEEEPWVGDVGADEANASQGSEDGGKEDSGSPAEDVPLSAGGNAEAKRICVHVDGCVEAPGVYYLPTGSRVIDAVTAAGGATDGARTDAVNLAQEVQDGQQVVIPSRAEEAGVSAGTADAAAAGGSQGAAAGSAPSQGDGLVNLNTASVEELQTLKGVGEATAEKIVADREANGPFRSIDDLTRVSGIGEKKLAAIRDRLCL